MSDGQPISHTLSARMQLGVLGTANTIAHSIRVGRGIADRLKHGGMLRDLGAKSKTPIHLTAICATGKRSEAFGGYLYMAAAVRRDITVHAGQVALGAEDSVCEIDMLPYGDVRQRIGLRQYDLIYRLLKRILSEPTSPDLLLIDRTLILPREFANSEDPQVTKEYRAVAKSAETFWTEVQPKLYPAAAGGLVIVGFPSVKRVSEPLWSIADGRAEALIDKVELESIKEALGRGKPLDDATAARIMGTIIWPHQRSAAFAYSALGIDSRAEPQVLHRGLDIASFHYRAGVRSTPQQIEVAGGRAWTSEALDRLADRLIEATPLDNSDAVPLPMWLGREDLKRVDGNGFLKQYQSSVFQALRSGELDESWLRGWEPEEE